MEEFSIIEKYFRNLTNQNDAAQNLEDDVARISVKDDEELVVSKDLIVEDVHFLKKDGAKKIAAKLLLSNLSDLAASGAKPLYYMLGFSKNATVDENFIADFCDSLREIQNEYGLCLIGGDTVSSKDKLFFSITIFGIVKKNKILARKNAAKEDLIFVSGSIGAAHLGLLINLEDDRVANFSADRKKYFLDEYFFPKPQIELAQKLVENNLSKCAIDVSDGLLADLRQICFAANLTAKIYKEKIPLACDSLDFRDLLSGGEDYQLIFSCKKNDENKILELAKKLKINLTYIGFFEKANNNPEVILLDEKNNEIKINKYGYSH